MSRSSLIQTLVGRFADITRHPGSSHDREVITQCVNYLLSHGYDPARFAQCLDDRVADPRFAKIAHRISDRFNDPNQDGSIFKSGSVLIAYTLASQQADPVDDMPVAVASRPGLPWVISDLEEAGLIKKFGVTAPNVPLLRLCVRGGGMGPR